MTDLPTWMNSPWAALLGALFREYVLPTLAAAIVAYIGKQMRDRNLDTQWFNLISRAGGEGYGALIASGHPVTSPEAWRAAADAGLKYMRDRGATIIASKGGREDDALMQIAIAETKRLLAADPTIGPAVAAGTSAVLGAVRGAVPGLGGMKLMEPRT